MGIFRVIDGKRRYRSYRARTDRLPASHLGAVRGLERYLTYFGPSGDMDDLLAMLDDLAELFEQAAADGTSVHAVVGDDPVGFAEEFLRNYPGTSCLSKERERLVHSLEQAESADRGDAS